MATGYSRVTVLSGARRVDLALPNTLPLCDVMPQLLRFCAPDERPARPAAWRLGRAGGADISLDHSLTQSGVLDGDVLELRSAEAPSRPAYVEDVRDAVEDVADTAGGQWRTSTTLSFLLVVAAGLAALAPLLPYPRRVGDPGAVLTALLVAAGCVAAAWWSGGRARGGIPAALVAVGGLWAGLAGWLVAGWLGWPPPVVVVAALAAALAAVVAARLLTDAAIGHLAALGVVTGAAVLATVAHAVWPPLTYGRVAGVATVLVIGVLPRASMAAGGLATADYRVRRAGLLTQQELAARARESGLLLLGALLGAAVVGALAGIDLGYAESGFDRLLGLAVGMALLLRSRVFSRISHVAPVRLAGVAVLVGHAVRLGSLPAVQPWLVAAGVLLAAGLVALAVAPFSDITRARIKRTLNWTENVVVVAMIALLAASVGLYDMVADLMR